MVELMAAVVSAACLPVALAARDGRAARWAMRVGVTVAVAAVASTFPTAPELGVAALALAVALAVDLNVPVRPRPATRRTDVRSER